MEVGRLVKQVVRITLLLSLFFGVGNEAFAGVIRKPPNNLGLMLYYPMDEGNGTVVTDHSGNRRNGSFTGTGTNPSWVNGKIGKSLDFSVATQDRRVDFSSFNTTNTHTVSMWIYVSSNCTGWGNLFSANAVQGLYCLNNGGGPRISYYYSAADHFNSTNLNLNQWYHVAVVNNAGTATFYINGVADGTAASAPGYIATGIGNDSLNEKFSGKIDDLRVYNRALSASEIQTIYQSGSAKIGITNTARVPANLMTDLTGWWTFDGKDMTSNVADVSGNGRHGYLVGFTSTTTAPGKIGQALAFNNTNKYAEMNGVSWSSAISASEGTMSAWVRPTGVAPTCIQSSFYNCKHAVSGILSTLADFGIARGNVTAYGGDYLWAVNATTYTTYQITGVPYTTGEWAHITWVHSDGVLSVYKNGVLASSTPSGDTFAESMNSNITIGRGWAGGANYWNGDIDDVRTWNRALSASEIKQVYDSTAGAKANKTNIGVLTSGLVGYYTFDGPDVDWTTNTVTDKSGNGRTGTLVNMSTTTSPTMGKIGQGVTFVAANSQSVSLSTNSTIQPGTGVSFTVSLWYKGLRGTTESFISSGPTVGNFWNIGNSEAVFATAGSSVSKSYTLPADNDWHHLVAVLDRQGDSNDSVTVYIDGVSQGSVTNTLNDESTAGAGGVNIGRGYWAGGGYRQGPMDEVRIYNRALSQSEVTQFYKMGK